MPTAAEFATFPDKRLLGATDFDARFFRYLRNESREAIKRLFIQGSFLERMPLSAPSANRIQVGVKPTYGDRMAHDGDGHLLDLSQIDTSTPFANVNTQVYEVGAGYIEYPKGIRTNPRSGAPEYDRYAEGIGVEATPATIINNGATLTLLINPLFEAGTTVANHAGRSVRVFKKLLAPNALTEVLAIEVATVTYDGAHNRITTVGLLGQTTVSTTAADYVVQLIGLNVLRLQATNRPSVLSAKMFFLGTVTGNGGTPSTFVTTAQGVIRSQDATQVTIAALGAWADGTLNPAGYVQGVVAKIVSDLTSVEVGTGRGLAKITAPALTGTPIALAAARADTTLQGVLDAANAETRRAECRAENASVQSLRLVATTSATPRALRAIAGVVWQGVAVRKIIAVGFQAAMIWEPTVKGGFAAITTSQNLYCVACAPSGEIYAGGDGGVYQLTGGPGTYAWNLVSSTPGVAIMAIVYRAANDCFVAVGTGSTIRRATTGGVWSSRSVPVEIGGGQSINNVAASDLYFLATTTAGSVMRSADGGLAWTFIYGLPNFAEDRALSYCPELGFVLVVRTNDSSYRVAASLDGASWTLSDAASATDGQMRIATLDRQIVLIRTWSSAAPFYSLPFTQVTPNVPAADMQGNIILPLDPVAAAFDANAVANICGQVWAVGRNGSDNGMIYMGNRFRPTYRGV